MALKKIGISSYSYPKACRAGMTTEKLIQKAIELDVKVVQMADNIHLEDYDLESLKKVAATAKQYGISIETGFRGLYSEKIKQYLKITEVLNARLMRIVIDGPGYQPSIKEICHMTETMLPDLEKKNMILGIETHDRFSALEFAEIIQKINSKYVAIILDASNSLANEERPLEVTEVLADKVVCFHAKDYRIQRRKSGMGLEIVGTEAGKGRLPIKKMLSMISEKSCYDFNVILELWTENYEITEETLKEEERWVEESIEYLRKIEI